MAQLPNAHAGQTVESLIRDELERGNVPLVCEEEGCDAVSGRSPSVLLRDRDEAHKACSATHEGCGGTMVVADLDNPVGPLEPYD